MPPEMRAEWVGEDRRDGADAPRDAADLEAARIADEWWGREV